MKMSASDGAFSSRRLDQIEILREYARFQQLFNICGDFFRNDPGEISKILQNSNPYFRGEDKPSQGREMMKKAIKKMTLPHFFWKSWVSAVVEFHSTRPFCVSVEIGVYARATYWRSPPRTVPQIRKMLDERTKFQHIIKLRLLTEFEHRYVLAQVCISVMYVIFRTHEKSAELHSHWDLNRLIKSS